jgi:hypothetical protein
MEYGKQRCNIEKEVIMEIMRPYQAILPDNLV